MKRVHHGSPQTRDRTPLSLRQGQPPARTDPKSRHHEGKIANRAGDVESGSEETGAELVDLDAPDGETR
jgi:hypothetical protein